jgi:tetratricopeptide (TPR) repeat protein
VHAARGLAYPPVLAEALLVQGHAQMMLEDRQAAVPILDEATRVAYAAGAYALAVEAWARRAWAQGTSNDPGGALAGLEWFEPLAQRPDAEFARALLYNNVGVVELAMNDPGKARNYLALALAASRKVTDDGALELLAILANIGILSPDRVQGDKLLADVAAERERRLGALHPDALEVQWLRGITTIEDLARAAEVMTPACAAYEQHEALADRRAQCWTEVGLLRWDLGDRNAAIAAMEHAAAGSPTQEPAAWLLFMSGDGPAAVQRFSDTLAAKAAAPGAAWWDVFSQLSLKFGLGRARRAAGDLRGARAVLEEAEAGLDAIARKQSATIYDRQRGRVRVELAQVVSEDRASPADRARRDDAARAWLQRVGAPPIDLGATTAAGSAK